MITPSEAGLTQEQWDALKASHASAVYQTIAHRWNPSLLPDHSTSTTVDRQFGAVEHDNTIYRIARNIVEFYDGSEWDTVSGFTAPDGLRNRPYSMISDTDLFVFAVTDTGIMVRSYDGSSWSSWSAILSDVTVTHMAAVASDYIHFITRDIENARYRFHVLRWNGMTWDTLNSQIHYPYPIYSFDARRYNGRDILILSTEVPGNLSAKFVNNTVVKYTLRAGGIIGFTHQYESWSDHFEIDILDEINMYRFRNNVRLSEVSGKLYLTCYSGDGDSTSALTFYREYSSKDGRHWSRGEYLPGFHDETSGVLLFRLGDNLFWIYASNVYKGISTLRFGHSPSSQQLDFSDEVSELKISRQDMQQLTMTLDTSTGWLTSSLLNGAEQAIIEVRAGYMIPNESEILEPVLVKIGMFELDSIIPSLELPDAQADLTARDFLAWMTTRTQAEQFKFWEPQTISGDNYIDDTDGTGYGGMGHTAVQTGSWRTDDGLALKLVSDNLEGMSWNTLLSQDNWNGMVQHTFQLASLGNNEYAGIVFRAQDKDNCFAYIYFQEDDVLKLIQREAGVDTVLWTSSAMNWDDDLNEHSLRVHYYYCQIRLFFSDDAITWVQANEYLVKGKPSTGITNDEGQVALTSAFIQSGFNGMIGYGFSDEAEWAGDPGPIPISVIPPDEAPFYTDPIDPGEEPDPPADLWTHEWDLRLNEGPLLPISNSVTVTCVWHSGEGFRSSTLAFHMYLNLPSPRVITGIDFGFVKYSLGFQNNYHRFVGRASAYTDAGPGEDMTSLSTPPGDALEYSASQFFLSSMYWNSNAEMDAAGDPYRFQRTFTNGETVTGVWLDFASNPGFPGDDGWGGSIGMKIAKLRITGEGTDPF